MFFSVTLWGTGTMATPDIHLLAIENWTTLAGSVDFSTLTETLHSSTSYTVSDSTSGLSLNVVGTGFTTENFFGYTVLATGTITGFTFSLNGKPIAKGSDYSLPASQLLGALETSIFAGNASPLFNLWFSIPTIVSGTAPIVEGNLENLLPEYVNIAAIDITSGAVSVSAAKFKTDENVLNEISAGFSISDTSTKVQPELGALAADVTHINSISFTNPSPVIKLTAAEATADAGALAQISSAYILDVQSTNGSWTTTGEGSGNDLTIHDIKGVDTITGGGTGENFVFNAGFGTATLTDFHNHLTGSTHDTVMLPSSEFGNSITALLHDDTKKSGTSVIISSGSDHLTLEHMTLSQLVATDFKLA
jgi:hypothetical protein